MTNTDKAFFYGTLMAPQVLSRVCHGTTHPEAWQRDRMTIQPALLRGYRRHKVRYADFPAIVPVQSSTAKPRAQEQTQPQSQSQSHTVRGTLVSGLTAADIMRLDIFEGSMYERVMVDVQTQGNRKNDNDNGNDNEMEKEKQMEEETGGQKYNNSSSNNKNKKINAAVFDSHADDDTFNGETVRVQTYVWAQPLHQLEPEEWNFEQFVRDRLHIWAGTSGKEDFEEVDRAAKDAGLEENEENEEKHDPTGGRGIDGDIAKQLEQEPAQAEKILSSAV